MGRAGKAFAIMAFAAYVVYSVMHKLLGVSISAVFGILTGVVVYAFAMVTFKGITAQELGMLPKGHILVGVFRKLGLLH